MSAEHVIYFDAEMKTCQRIISKGNENGKLSIKPKELAASIERNWYAVSVDGGKPIKNIDYKK